MGHKLFPPELRHLFYCQWCRNLCYYRKRYAIVKGGGK